MNVIHLRDSQCPLPTSVSIQIILSITYYRVFILFFPLLFALFIHTIIQTTQVLAQYLKQASGTLSCLKVK